MDIFFKGEGYSLLAPHPESGYLVKSHWCIWNLTVVSGVAFRPKLFTKLLMNFGSN